MSFEREKIRKLVEIYYDVQDVRIRTANRLRTVGEVEGVDPDILKRLENQIKNYIKAEIKNIPIVKNYLRNIKGIGVILAGALISFLDIRKTDHASSFWKYMGLHVKDGKAVKRERGSKIDYNPKLKPFYWKIGKSFIRAKTPFYIDIYYKTKQEEIKKLNNPIENPKNCPYYEECIERLKAKAERTGKEAKNPPCRLHIDLRAMRKMVKRFLSDFWVEWRKYEGLPVTPPYAHRFNQKK
jgi:hypothetical protein